MESTKIKVFLSDSQVLFREGIHFTLSAEEDFEVTGETTNNEEALSFIEANPPNIVILNIKNDKLDGPSVTRRIKRNLPSVLVMLMADRDDEELLYSAIKCGASAYLTKDIDPERLLDLIRVLAQGSQPMMEFLLLPVVASRILEEFEALSPLSEQMDSLLARLSSGEAEILSSITEGNDIEKIKADSNCDEETIRKHLRSVRSKLVANDQAQTMIEVVQKGLAPVGPGTGYAAMYVTKKEFNEFKEALADQFRSLISESHKLI